MKVLRKSPSPIHWRIKMSFGDVIYIIAIFLFVFLTFGIVRNYYKNKFDDEGRRIDMQEEADKKEE